jgi:hypothetical protein
MIANGAADGNRSALALLGEPRYNGLTSFANEAQINQFTQYKVHAFDRVGHVNDL